MTFDDILDSLRDLGECKWKPVNAGIRVDAEQRSWRDDPFDLPVTNKPADRWVWPNDLDVGFDIEWLYPIDVDLLGQVGATIAQPINLRGLYRGDAVVAVPGLIVWAGWCHREVDPHHYDPPWVLPIPDENGRVIDWQAKALAVALDIAHELNTRPLNEIAELLGRSMSGISSLTVTSGRADLPSSR
jgi:hypothetical protein